MHVYLIPFAFALILAVYNELRVLDLNKALYGPALFALGLFGGLRLETGKDWRPYEAFFTNVDVARNPFSSYFGDVLNLQFEFGYYLVNWVVKRAGGDYWVVFLIASVFCAYGVYRFTRRFPGNKFYILLIYIGYSFPILHFAQVRQSIAIGCFLLGFDHYLEHGKRWRALAVCALGPLFQYSAVIYILIFVVTVWWPKRREYKLLAIAALAAASMIPFIYDPYSLAALVSTTRAAEKITFYQETQDELGAGRILYAVYLLLLIGYLTYYGQDVPYPKVQLVIRYAVISLLVTVLLIFIFPGSYVMYSRGYVVASIFHGYAASLLFRMQLGWVHKFVFVGTIVVAFVYYARLLVTFGDAYVPYRSVVLCC